MHVHIPFGKKLGPLFCHHRWFCPVGTILGWFQNHVRVWDQVWEEKSFGTSSGLCWDLFGTTHLPKLVTGFLLQCSRVHWQSRREARASGRCDSGDRVVEPLYYILMRWNKLILGLFISTYLYPHIYPLPTHGRAIFQMGTQWDIPIAGDSHGYVRETLLPFACLGYRWDEFGTVVGNAPLPITLPQNSFQWMLKDKMWTCSRVIELAVIWPPMTHWISVWPPPRFSQTRLPLPEVHQLN